MQSYDALCAYLKKSSGLVLDRDKRYLVDSRLLPIVQREKLSGLPELVNILESFAFITVTTSDHPPIFPFQVLNKIDLGVSNTQYQCFLQRGFLLCLYDF